MPNIQIHRFLFYCIYGKFLEHCYSLHQIFDFLNKESLHVSVTYFFGDNKYALRVRVRALHKKRASPLRLLSFSQALKTCIFMLKSRNGWEQNAMNLNIHAKIDFAKAAFVQLELDSSLPH